MQHLSPILAFSVIVGTKNNTASTNQEWESPAKPQAPPARNTSSGLPLGWSSFRGSKSGSSSHSKEFQSRGSTFFEKIDEAVSSGGNASSFNYNSDDKRTNDHFENTSSLSPRRTKKTYLL